MAKKGRNEASTRAELIDPKLKNAGWGEEFGSYIRREARLTNGRIMTTGNKGKPLIADYILEYQGRKLAVIEAKREGLSYTEGVQQAKEYAQRLQCRIAYSSNGHDIYQIDMLTGRETLVERFLTPHELSVLINSDLHPETSVWRSRFAQVPFECKSDWIPRYYQECAINNALDAIAKGDERILLTLATGTGKTCIAFQIAWKLFNAKWSVAAQKQPEYAEQRPRILFLADRNILADQAYLDFMLFGEDALARITPNEIKKSGSVPKNASVFFTIFQTFMSGEGENATPYFGDYPSDFFDIVIVDECHRAGANDKGSWRDVLNYFSSAVHLGLTATPKHAGDVDTYGYFGEPVYTYSLKQGINDGFLTPFKMVAIVGTMDNYVYTPGDGNVIEGNPEPGRLYTEGDFNRLITIPEREKKRVHYWMDLFNPNEKTLVFCATQEHAGKIRDYVNSYAVQNGWSNNVEYCVRVTANDGTAGENYLGTFRDNEKTIPTVLTTSRKLSTGVDARNIRNIVLMRPCKDMIEFKQIIGRGTRLYEGKHFFTVYDFVKAYQNFSDPDWDGEAAIERSTPRSIKDMLAASKGVAEPLQHSPAPESNSHTPITLKLNDGKVRQIQHVSSIMYWDMDGRPVTAKQFVEKLFDDLPKFFQDEEQLRSIWSNPATRDELLCAMSENGYDINKLEGLKKAVGCAESDVYDFLSYIAYASKPKSRKERVQLASPNINKKFTTNQKEFIDFVLDKYLEDGVSELSFGKISKLVELKYGSLSDASQKIGSMYNIRKTFSNFQSFLY